jgi:catechol 2,3-dioxygenase-like lactoylglutathione lyase family enzyme
MRIFRVLLEVGDAERATAFYAALLGRQGRAVGGGRVYFDCADVIFALVDTTLGGSDPQPTPEEIYFAVPDLEAVYERARGLGCLSTEDIHGVSGGEIALRPWGERSFYVLDAWNNRLCFVDDTTLFTGR